MDSTTQTVSQRIDMAMLVVSAEHGQASCCLIGLPDSFTGTTFTKLIQVGSEFFVETAEGDRYSVPNIDEVLFDQAKGCTEQVFNVDLDGETGVPLSFPAEFLSEEPVYRPGV